MKALWLLIITTLFSSMAFSNGITIENVEFSSHGDTLSGTLLMSTEVETQAAVVFVHGSGEQSRNIHFAKHFANHGIAALVYDKRGVGQSEGKYESQQSVSEKNLNLLADDAVSALALLRQHQTLKNVKVGFAGISQAGWIIPLAAEKTSAADFMVIWSGPVTKVSEEDIYSKYTADLDSQRVPPYATALASRKRQYIWPDFLGKDSNPVDSLINLTIPGLWIFGEKDGSIPVDLSIERLKNLQKTHDKYDYILFSSQGHNNMRETFTVAVEWMKKQSD